MNADTFLAQIKSFAREANVKYFDGQLNLSVVAFKVSTRAFRSLGQFSCRIDRITGKAINQKLMVAAVGASDVAHWQNTVVHELVHCWQAQTSRPLDHGNSFISMSNQIRRRDPKMVITRTCKNTPASVKVSIAAKRSRKHGFAVQNPPQTLAAQIASFGKTTSINDVVAQIMVAHGLQFSGVHATPELARPAATLGKVSTKEFVVNKGARYLFITNLNFAEIALLKGKGWTVSKNLGMSCSARVRKCKNIDFLLNANYSYNLTSVNKVMPSRMEM
jgi:hypothetical protein